jgi:hypothetical protein
VLVYVFLCARRILHFQGPVGLCKVYAHSDCYKAMHGCAGLCDLVDEAHADCDCCEAMHACVLECVLVHKVHAHCDCC